MKKQTLSVVAVVFLASLLQGQVGINTTSPRVTLDVVAKNSDGSSPEGILAPRLTGNALFTASGSNRYGAQQDGAIVYVTAAASPANNIGQTVNVDAVGYYYFDATANQWKKMGGGSNIYTTNGTLSNARTMDMNNLTMGFVNGRMSVGINAADPSAQLHVQSTTQGFLPPRMTRAQVDAITNPASGLVVYCTDFLGAGKGCLLVNDSTDPAVPKWGSMCSANSISPAVLTLDCATRTVSGNLYQGAAAAGVTVVVPYTGGNGGVYSAVSSTSTGVSGLTASLQSGLLSSGNGSVTFTVTGTPAATGNANFAITVAGQSCSFSVPVTVQPTVSSITCGNASFTPANIQTGSLYNGTMTVPYTGGNGVAYAAGAAQAINGLTFTRQAGTLNNGAGNITYNVTGTPTNAVAMNIPVAFNGAAQCDVSQTVTPAATVNTLNCVGAIFTPNTIENGTAYNGTMTVPYTGGNGASYVAGAAQSINGLTFTRQAGTLNNGAGNITYNVTGTPTNAVAMNIPVAFNGATECTVSKAAIIRSASVDILNCGSAVFTPNRIESGTAYNGTMTVPYTGGNGVAYAEGPAFTRNGLTFTRQAGTLNNGAGNITYNVTGTPNSVVLMNIPIAFNGAQDCIIFKDAVLRPVIGNTACVQDNNIVVSPLPVSGALYNGTMTVPYTGGNGATYPEGPAFTRNGLTYRRQAGTLNNGPGNVIFNISGFLRPNGDGPSFGIITLDYTMFDEMQMCGVTVVPTLSTVTTIGGSTWKRTNIGYGLTEGSEPFTDNSGSSRNGVASDHGNYYQWGRSTVVATPTTNSAPIVGWNATAAPNGSWSETTKTANDPCPAGFKVPTAAQFIALINGTVQTNMGTFQNNNTNFNAVKVFTAADGSYLYFPISGYRDGNNGELRDLGFEGYYWTSTYDEFRKVLRLNQNGVEPNLFNGVNFDRSAGASVRCVAE